MEVESLLLRGLMGGARERKRKARKKTGSDPDMPNFLQ
jgi:hypothetical protein